VRLINTAQGPVLEVEDGMLLLAERWDALLQRPDLFTHATRCVEERAGVLLREARAIAPVGRQEVWAAGVTYLRSRVARNEESSGGQGEVLSVYDRVYDAARPELFFKAAGWRVRGPGEEVRIRRDARWSVPEPEVALVVAPSGDIAGYTIGNDMSSRDIEGENPLYLPQAKMYDGSCALGPAVLLTDRPLPPETRIAMAIRRGGATVYEGETTFSRMRWDPRRLVEYLMRETSFPDGCVLLTGTGVVPPADFTLQGGDAIDISVDGIGVLSNKVSDT